MFVCPAVSTANGARQCAVAETLSSATMTTPAGGGDTDGPDPSTQQRPWYNRDIAIFRVEKIFPVLWPVQPALPAWGPKIGRKRHNACASEKIYLLLLVCSKPDAGPRRHQVARARNTTSRPRWRWYCRTPTPPASPCGWRSGRASSASTGGSESRPGRGAAGAGARGGLPGVRGVRQARRLRCLPSGCRCQFRVGPSCTPPVSGRYTLLVGRPPFETSDVKTTYKKIKTVNYSFPESLPISSHARHLIRRILQSQPGVWGLAGCPPPPPTHHHHHHPYQPNPPPPGMY